MAARRAPENPGWLSRMNYLLPTTNGAFQCVAPAPIETAGADVDKREKLATRALRSTFHRTGGHGPLRSRGVALLVTQPLFDDRNRLAQSVEVGIDLQRALEELQRLLQVTQAQVDLAGARQRAKVIGVALEHLVAILQRLLVLAEQEVHRRTLVPAFGERGLARDDLVEHRQRLLEHLPLHVLDAAHEQLVDRRVAGARPDLPDRIGGRLAHVGVGIAEAPQQPVGVGLAADRCEPFDAFDAGRRVGMVQRLQRLLARQRRGVRRNGHAEQHRHDPSDAGSGHAPLCSAWSIDCSGHLHCCSPHRRLCRPARRRPIMKNPSRRSAAVERQ
jgi:hypothetical protein